jgi:hypothetical protein
MTRTKDVIPSPSQPSSSIIRFGIKIRSPIDRTKRSTRIVKRLMN